MKKEIQINTELFNKIRKNTNESRVFSGYFLVTQEKRFCGKISENKLNIYCTDYLLQFLNPLITVNKTTNLAVIKYNAFQIFLNVICIFLLICCSLFIETTIFAILTAILIIVIGTLVSCLFFSHRTNKIINIINSL